MSGFGTPEVKTDTAGVDTSVWIRSPAHKSDENVSSSPMRQSLCEKSLGSAIGRRNRLPHQGKPSSYRTVGQAVSPVERLFTGAGVFESVDAARLGGRALLVYAGVNGRTIDLVVRDPAVDDFDDAVAPRGIDLGMRHLDDRRAALVQLLEYVHDFLGLI